ncbi:MAG: hypothetical protein SGJ18_08335 [Pseudomonadota bacterium]|nr:hypothetical protein [Pseudomonadota bacterium]
MRTSQILFFISTTLMSCLAIAELDTYYCTTECRYITTEERTFWPDIESVQTDEVTGSSKDLNQAYQTMNDKCPGNISPNYRSKKAYRYEEQTKKRHLCRKHALKKITVEGRHEFNTPFVKIGSLCENFDPVCIQSYLHASEEGFKQAVGKCSDAGGETDGRVKVESLPLRGADELVHYGSYDAIGVYAASRVEIQCSQLVDLAEIEAL